MALNSGQQTMIGLDHYVTNAKRQKYRFYSNNTKAKASVKSKPLDVNWMVLFIMDIQMTEMTIEDIKNALKPMALNIAMELLDNPKKQGIRVYGNAGGKCSVVVSGADQGLVGMWSGQRGDKQGGSLLDLIEISLGTSNFSEALRYAKSHYLGITDREFTPEEKAAWAKRQEAMKVQAQENKRQSEAKRKEKIISVKGYWNQSQPIKGTIADKYLTNRICEHDWPPTLKFHPAFPLEIDNNKPHPCLVAAVQGSDRKLTAVWRIYLNPDGTNLIIDGDKVKMGFGPSSGGVVRLTEVKGLWRVGEGLESTLGAMALNRFQGNWAASLSTSGMRGFEVPKEVDAVGLYSDGDMSRVMKDGRILEAPGQSAAKAKQRDLYEVKIAASIHEPPENSDWLDVWETARDE